jgi:UDP-N-acetylglucosamine 2-epimerase (non-hydrolysing)
VTRDSTERPEALAAGATRLIGTNPDRVFQEVRTLLTNRDAYEAMQVDVNPYGDGRASQRIVELALQRFSAAESSARAPSLIPELISPSSPVRW